MEGISDKAILHFEPMCRGIASEFWLPSGGDREDLAQEARIGMVEGLRDFNGNGSLGGFVAMCARRKVITALKTATRHKHGAINGAVSLSAPVGDEDLTVGDFMSAGAASDPAQVVEDRDEFRRLTSGLASKLTAFERGALGRWLNGESYEQIAAAYGTNIKAVDNAIQRVKEKADKVLQTTNNDNSHRRPPRIAPARTSLRSRAGSAASRSNPAAGALSTATAAGVRSAVRLERRSPPLRLHGGQRHGRSRLLQSRSSRPRLTPGRATSTCS